MRRSISIALCTSVVLGALSVPAGTAFAAAGEAALGAVEGHRGGLGRLFVDDLRTDSDVSAIRAVVHRAGEDVAVETVHDFALVEGDRKAGDWRTEREVKLEITGLFSVDLVVTEADGDETTFKDAGTYDYTAKRAIEGFDVDNPNPTLDHRGFTASGRVVEWQPVTHERTPVAGAAVTVKYGDTYGVFGDTNAKGEFRYAFTASGSGAKLAVRASSQGAKPSEVRTVAPVPTSGRITLTPATPVLTGKVGDRVTVRGTAEYRGADGTWKPLRDARVHMTGTSTPVRAYTAADGSFAFKQTIPGGSVTSDQVHLYYGEWLTNMPTGDVTYRRVGVASIHDFSVSLDAYAQLTVNGRVAVRDAALPHRNVDLQWSRTGRDGWMKVTTLRLDGSSGFKTTVPAPPTGYYRAVYKNTAFVTGAVGPVLYAGRAETRIKDFNASPEPVRKGGTITVTGTLLHRTPSWKAYAGKPVLILFRPKGDEQWYLMTEVKSAANGTFRRNFREVGDGSWVAVHAYPNSRHLVSASAEDYVDVK
ncbi:hypothetical protein ACF1G0_13655 [Streptomyces sp. NPDC013953]|uniref:hypothetical protein n=1 Tax=Streptomyces sp. NPDC013953 TaxID=3364868 RepID=UPI0036F7FD30